MTTSDTDLISTEADDDRLLDAVKAYQVELDEGRADRQTFLDRHADLAAALVPYLDGLDLLHRGARQLAAPGDGLHTGLGTGDRLGEFEIVRELGRGGMGVVYEAVQRSLGRRVAVKVLPAALAVDPARLGRFRVEAQATAAVNHPHIVPVFAVGEDRGIHYLVMRLIDGAPLDRLKSETAKPTDTALPFSELAELARSNRLAYHRAVARLGERVARALDHAHQNGVVHRDIKPANLLLDPDGHVWVTDFGLAQIADGAAVTRTGTALGTLRYMSPEQASGDRRQVDHRTDVYSLAVSLYELHAGQPAFPSDEAVQLLRQIAAAEPPQPRAVDPTIPVDLETVLLKATQKEPRDRYVSAAELADDLARFASGERVLARRPSAWDWAKRWVARHPATVAATLVSLLVTGGAAWVVTAVVSNEGAETRRTLGELQVANAATEKAQEEAAARAVAERTRAEEAEQRFRRAKELGDLVLQISEEEIGSDRPLQGARRRLLVAALENSRGLLASGYGDAQVRGELGKVVARVESLLAEQDLRWEADGAFLLKDPHVRAELALSSDQTRRIDRAFSPTKGPPRPLDKQPGKGPADRGPLRQFDPPLSVKIELIKELSLPQRSRLRQVSLQWRAPMVFNDPEVIDLLHLTFDQRRQIKAILQEEWGGPPGRDLRPPQPGGKDAKALAVERILDVLSDEQTELWTTLTGKPFAPRR